MRPDELLQGLNPDQRRAVEATNGPVCILAGAGSGKTRTITHRVAYQVATGVARPEQILAVTFTDKAAGELRRRLRGLGIARPIRAATFHAAAWAQLRYFWPQRNNRGMPQVLASKVPLLTRAARRHHAEARDLAAEIEWAKARCLSPDEYPGATARQPPIAATAMRDVYAGYEQIKAEQGLIDYEDMLLETTRLLEEDPAVAAAVRDRYRFFTVDEFQDVNLAQWRLLRAWLGEGQQLCVVGDDDQTIYSFTGASAEYLTGFRRHFPAASVITLTDNYRSTRQVLDLANRLLGSGGTKAPLRPHSDGGPTPMLRAFDDEHAERRGVIDQVKSLVAGGVSPGELAVCYRVNSQSEPWEEALQEAGIPYLVRGEGGFFERPEVRQALELLRRAGQEAPAVEPGPGGAMPATAPEPRRRAEEVLRQRLSWHPRREPEGDRARERWRNLGALLALVERIAAERHGIDLAGVAADLSERAAAGQPTADESGAVTLLTLHKAKGLEFDAVFVVACEEGLIPISYATSEPEIAEERRLLYVGVTRARRHLWLSWATTRSGWGGRSSRRRPSRFLHGLTPAKRPAVVASGDIAGRGGPASGEAAGRGVVDEVRAWRLERARADGVPAYVVFSDRTLRELAEQRPGTLAELRLVHGLGPTKVRRYGDELLRLIDAAR